MSIFGDICTRLRQADDVGSQSLASLGNGALMKEAALLIEQLRSEVLRLERLKTPEDQHAAGYAEAQADIRRALGID